MNIVDPMSGISYSIFNNKGKQILKRFIKKYKTMGRGLKNRLYLNKCCKDWECENGVPWKKCYRSLILEHHPDKGGDKSTFQKLSNCNDLIGNELENTNCGRPPMSFPGSSPAERPSRKTREREEEMEAMEKAERAEKAKRRHDFARPDSPTDPRVMFRGNQLTCRGMQMYNGEHAYFQNFGRIWGGSDGLLYYDSDFDPKNRPCYQVDERVKVWLLKEGHDGWTNAIVVKKENEHEYIVKIGEVHWLFQWWELKKI